MVSAPVKSRPKPSPGSAPSPSRLLAEEKAIADSIKEIPVQCPKCKAMQTVSFIKGHLIPTRKFAEKDGKVYHDCGGTDPCRLLMRMGG